MNKESKRPRDKLKIIVMDKDIGFLYSRKLIKRPPDRK